ncbi:DUF2911 domain-containing protein [Roseivirga pacifica]|uniref:DUF2911 domain-containing protein n=1 Tax=Roseivirga pacifica TaxID=1267423 RepID=UPI002095D837|nr:DUF2911 domain-containing protein [Roseivirga pacifica]MCO6360215.1 DUF2911 domain-containing protein [Roseivirga pacifica]MCO6367586.1 DUF2911 domain-containing protein [Roseivirga pacifica]MCO6369882.1 DUF2911 domain-containing protein [Roseivirga pacifica]MCO6375243.1 DUF2911 domain-containing protein [Roseivirga pacifica]MCO6380501.1 DUF2911 domain-containing protein [Roseivirga pacifica]
MKRITLTFLLLLFIEHISEAQFHTLNIPQISNHVYEEQRLAVTDISIDYSSPSTNNRDVWNTPGIIPQNGNPIAWRAGANMNTTISFSTDVMINGQALKKGKYGFHIIPNGEDFTLLFAHNNNQWGSYYLDLEKDITLRVNVKSEACSFSEKLDYEFLNWQENAVTVALEWGEKRIPFEVSVDLNKTVVESFRSELRGINTYHWQAWNDAANWCLNHNTNLEEALAWANRSINGGYNGFAANRNTTNLITKIRLQKALDRTAEMNATIDEAIQINMDVNQANYLSIMLLQLGAVDQAHELLSREIENNPEAWFLKLNQAIAYYYSGNKKKSLKALEQVYRVTPENFKARLDQIKSEIENDTYKIPSI